MHSSPGTLFPRLPSEPCLPAVGWIVGVTLLSQLPVAGWECSITGSDSGHQHLDLSQQGTGQGCWYQTPRPVLCPPPPPNKWLSGLCLCMYPGLPVSKIAIYLCLIGVWKTEAFLDCSLVDMLTHPFSPSWTSDKSTRQCLYLSVEMSSAPADVGSVRNCTRISGGAFMSSAAHAPLCSQQETWPLSPSQAHAPLCSQQEIWPLSPSHRSVFFPRRALTSLYPVPPQLAGGLLSLLRALLAPSYIPNA